MNYQWTDKNGYLNTLVQPDSEPEPDMETEKAEEVGGIICPIDPQKLNECEACQ